MEISIVSGFVPTVLVAVTGTLCGWLLCLVWMRRTARRTNVQPADSLAFDDEIARRLSELQCRGRVFSLMLLSVDDLGALDDIPGCREKDETQSDIAQFLRKRMRTDDSVLQCGEKKFAIILPGTSVSDAQNVATSILSDLRNGRFSFEGENRHVTACIGLSQMLPEDNASILLQRTEAALEAAEKSGHGHACWHDGRSIERIRPREKNLAKDHERKLSPSEYEDENTVNSPNRATFCLALRHRLAESKRTGEPLSVIMIRIDGHAALRERLGHHAVSQILQAMARYFVAAMREMDWVVPFSATTFTLLLPRTRGSNAIKVAERLRENLVARDLSVEGQSVQMTISAGATEAIDDDTSEKLLQRAEEAMKAAIRAGGNCSCSSDGASRPHPAPTRNEDTTATSICHSPAEHHRIGGPEIGRTVAIPDSPAKDIANLDT